MSNEVTANSSNNSFNGMSLESIEKMISTKNQELESYQIQYENLHTIDSLDSCFQSIRICQSMYSYTRCNINSIESFLADELRKKIMVDGYMHFVNSNKEYKLIKIGMNSVQEFAKSTRKTLNQGATDEPTRTAEIFDKVRTLEHSSSEILNSVKFRDWAKSEEKMIKSMWPNLMSALVIEKTNSS